MKFLFTPVLLLILILASSCSIFEESGIDLPYDTPTPTSSPVLHNEPTPVKTDIPTPTPSPTPKATNITSGGAQTTNKFTGSEVSFNYPGNWEKINTLGLIASFRDKETGAFIQVAVTDIGFYPTQKELQTYQDAWVGSGLPLYEGTVEGYSGIVNYQTTFAEGNERGRIVSFARYTKIYDISLSAPATSFDKANKDFNVLVASFKMP
jgi:hypothetical protein